MLCILKTKRNPPLYLLDEISNYLKLSWRPTEYSLTFMHENNNILYIAHTYLFVYMLYVGVNVSFLFAYIHADSCVAHSDFRQGQRPFPSPPRPFQFGAFPASSVLVARGSFPGAKAAGA